jgi:hypothetical protein
MAAVSFTDLNEPSAMDRLTDLQDRLHDLVVGHVSHPVRDPAELEKLRRDMGEVLAVAEDLRSTSFDVRPEDISPLT